MKKFKNADQEYQFYVEQGRNAISKIDCYQAKIAAMAVKVCEIKHGGKVRSTDYTMTKYANDIGLNRKTLSEWVRVYRAVISKLDVSPELISKEDWATASRVMFIINEDKRVKQALTGIKGKKQRGHSKDYSAEEVKGMFKSCQGSPSLQARLYQWINTVSYIKAKLSESNLSEVSLSSAISLKEALDNASDVILRHITGSVLKVELGGKAVLASQGQHELA